jgi:glucose/arabinose dehydrogenase
MLYREPRPVPLAHAAPTPAAAEPLEGRTLLSVPAGFTQSLVAGGIASPTAMAVAPDGRVFVSQKAGQLRVVKNGQLLSTPFLTVNTTNVGERGLLGIAFDPDFAANKYVYVYYTATSPAPHNRVSRFTAGGDVAVAGSEKVLLDQPALGTATNHNGGDMHFGPDGKLYIAVGENAQPDLSPSLTSTFGKVLRINKDGSIPTDNPFYNQTTGVYRSIWARGFRNPYTFDVQPGTGKIYVNDVGHVGDEAWEEIDLLTKGANYGWPAVQGPQTGSSQYQNPVYSYQHGPGGVNGICIAGAAFYNPPAGAANAFGAAYAGDYFFADFGAGWVHVLDADGGGVADFATGLTNPVDLAVAADGSLLYLQRGNASSPAGLYKIAKVAGPGILTEPQDATVAPGEPATFTVEANGPGTLSYQWLRNGQPIAGATAASYTLASAQAADSGAVFRVRVTNTGGSVTSDGATLTVTGNRPPAPAISAPLGGSKFVAGQPVQFAGGATDPEDGTVPAAGLTWSVSYFTNGQKRPAVAPFSGTTGGSFTPDTVTPYLGIDVFCRVYLTATDSAGRKATVYRDVQPTVSTFKLATAVMGGSATPGLTLTLDGNPQTTPKTISSVVGLTRTLAAPASQTVGGVTYDFVSWSDGKAASHTISVKAAATTYAATYKVRAGGTVKSLSAVADSYVTQGNPSVNFGSAGVLNARRSSSTYNQAAYLTFDLSTVSTITSAVLKLYGKQTVAGPAVNVAAYKVANTTWGEKTITWDNRPTLGAAIGGGTSVNSTAGGWYSWDLTAYLKAEKAAGRSKVSVGLFGLSATTPVASFNAREAAANRPVLEAR